MKILQLIFFCVGSTSMQMLIGKSINKITVSLTQLAAKETRTDCPANIIAGSRLCPDL